MIAYFFLIAFPVIFSFLPIHRNAPVQKVMLFFTGLIYIFFIGFRHEVGADLDTYLGMYDYIASGTIEEGTVSMVKKKT